MTIKPLGGKVQIEFEKPSVGGLDLSAKETAQEVGKVIAIGENVKNLKVGDRIMYKGWGVDVITYNDEKYYFIDSTSEGVCAIIE